MALRTPLKNVSVCLICTLMIHMAAYISARYILEHRMSHAVLLMKERGWRIAFDPHPQAQMRFFGAAITYRNLELVDDLGHRFGSSALSITHQPFLSPRLHFDDAALRDKLGNRASFATIDLRLNGVGKWSSYQLSGFDLSAIADDSAFLSSPQISGHFRIRPQSDSHLISFALTADADRFDFHGARMLGKFNMPSCVFAKLSGKAAFDFRPDAVTARYDFSRLYVQEVLGHLGPLDMRLSGTLDGHGGGYLSTQMKNIKSALTAWRTRPITAMPEATRSQLLKLSENLLRYLPDRMLFSLRIQNWQIEPVAQTRLETFFNVLNVAPPL